MHPNPAEPLPPRCPVVYLPGIDGTGRLIHRQVELQEKYALHCVSYPQDIYHTYADLVTQGLRELYRTGPAVLLAESFGGAVALLLALERPDLVRRLVLVNTFAYYPRRLVIDFLALIGRWLPDRPAPVSTRRLRGYCFFSSCTPKREHDLWWKLTSDVPMQAYGRRFQLISQLDLRPRLHELAIPTLVFVSPDDWIVPPPAGRMLARRLPQAQLIELRASHAAMIDPRVNVAAWLQNPSLWATTALPRASKQRSHLA
jgi:pimeloyl-ACP methyl ester carboxylesterase